MKPERFVPWPLNDLPSLAGRDGVKRDPYDCRTWGSSCGRGWVRDERFGSGQVIKGKPRAAYKPAADSGECQMKPCLICKPLERPVERRSVKMPRVIKTAPSAAAGSA